MVIALAGLVGGTIMSTITRQQRFYRGASELLYVREGVRDAMEVLSTDVRATSVADTVRLAADSAVEFFATIGASVVCQITSNDVGLPAAHPSGNSLSAFLVEPDTGDLALFHLDSAGANERWERRRISGLSHSHWRPAVLKLRDSRNNPISTSEQRDSSLRLPRLWSAMSNQELSCDLSAAHDIACTAPATATGTLGIADAMRLGRRFAERSSR